MYIEIKIDTRDEMNEIDLAVLRALTGAELPLLAQAVADLPSVPAAKAKAEEPKPEPEKPKAKPGPKPKPAPEPDPEPEPVAEEAVMDDADQSREDFEDVKDDDEAEGDMAVAVEKATALVSSGRASDVKAALAKVGVNRVSELTGPKINAFLAALEA